MRIISYIVPFYNFTNRQISARTAFHRASTGDTRLCFPRKTYELTFWGRYHAAGKAIRERYIVNVTSTFLHTESRTVKRMTGTCAQLQSLHDLYHSEGNSFLRVIIHQALKLRIIDASTWRFMLKFGPQMLELRCWNLAAQLDSQPSPALATHLYDKQPCSKGASGEPSNPFQTVSFQGLNSNRSSIHSRCQNHRCRKGRATRADLELVTLQ